MDIEANVEAVCSGLLEPNLPGQTEERQFTRVWHRTSIAISCILRRGSNGLWARAGLPFVAGPSLNPTKIDKWID